MSVQKTDPRGWTIDPGRIREIIAVTRVWLGIGEERRVRQLTALAPEEVLRTLQAGEQVQWQGWSIKTTAPRRIGLPRGESEWATGLMAVSAHGLVSELRISPDGVGRICLRIAEMESRQALARLAERPDRAFVEWELE